MANWKDAIQDLPGGCRLLVEVSAGSKVAGFPVGFNQWREGRIGLRVRAPALEGRANEEVVHAIADFFGVPQSQVSIESGHLGTRKNLNLLGVSHDQAIARLSPLLEP